MIEHSNNVNIVELEKFIQATRDAGYKAITTALAELIDNSFEANATQIKIDIIETNSNEKDVIVIDNGCGMKPSTLQTALQFGGSTRFNSRMGMGRFGMGLPNSSISQARRVDVYTRRKKKRIWWSYLDIDEIISGEMSAVPAPKCLKSVSWFNQAYDTGTVILWSKCDRIKYKNRKTFLAKIAHILGRLFRKHIWEGKKIYLCDDEIKSVDPLFLEEGNNLTGAKRYGPSLNYEIEYQDELNRKKKSLITAQFVQLPVEEWHSLPNEKKQFYGISKSAGVSIVRAGREIDSGWFFMGRKRKENYDDWWRCEIAFEPDLDEAFGVANTKQGIRPTEFLKSILTPDIERVAHTLNSEVRKRYAVVRSKIKTTVAVKKAIRRDVFLSPPENCEKFDLSIYGLSEEGRINIQTKYPISGLSYRIVPMKLDEKSFFVPVLNSSEIIIILNEEHPFFECVYSTFMQSSSKDAQLLFQQLELMLIAAARAECALNFLDDNKLLKRLREEWSKALMIFLE